MGKKLDNMHLNSTICVLNSLCLGKQNKCIPQPVPVHSHTLITVHVRLPQQPWAREAETGPLSLTAICNTVAQQLLRAWTGLKDTERISVIAKQICLSCILICWGLMGCFKQKTWCKTESPHTLLPHGFKRILMLFCFHPCFSPLCVVPNVFFTAHLFSMFFSTFSNPVREMLAVTCVFSWRSAM